MRKTNWRVSDTQNHGFHVGQQTCKLSYLIVKACKLIICHYHMVCIGFSTMHAARFKVYTVKENYEENEA